MPLIQIVMVLIVVGVLLWAVNLIPMQGTMGADLSERSCGHLRSAVASECRIFSSFSNIRVGHG